MIPFVAVLTSACALLASACAPTGAEGPDGGDKVADHSDAINAYIFSLPPLPLADSQPKTQMDCAGNCPPPEQNGEEYCSFRRYTETAQFEDFVTFQPNSATLWPGVIVRGEDAANGMLTPVGVEMAPVTFSLSLENITASPVGVMDKPSLSAFRDARNAILADGVTGATPAALDFQVVQVNSSSQLSVALGADVSWPGGPELAASFDFSTSSEKTKILVNFTQAYYTVDVDTPAQPSDFFAQGIAVEELEHWMGVGSPPLYVQSITYGRRVIFSVQTNHTATEIKAALNASYKAASIGGSAMLSTEHKKTLAESDIKAFVLGGSGEQAALAIEGFDGLVQYIKSGGNYSNESPGAPIAYKLSYLDNSVTRMAFTTDYAEKNCVKNLSDVYLTLDSLRHVAGGDASGGPEIYGQVLVRYPTQGNPVTDCNTGGELATIWSVPQGSYVEIADKGTYYPPNSAVDLHEVPITDSAKICLIADMWEDDNPSADDDFGIAGVLLTFKDDGWEGEHEIVTHGDGDNSMAAKVSVEVK